MIFALLTKSEGKQKMDEIGMIINGTQKKTKWRKNMQRRKLERKSGRKKIYKRNVAL
jgi:hypothetical protein